MSSGGTRTRNTRRVCWFGAKEDDFHLPVNPTAERSHPVLMPTLMLPAELERPSGKCRKSLTDVEADAAGY